MKQLNNEKLFAFILGREQKIALLELESVLRSFCFDFYHEISRGADKNNPESCRGMGFSILSVVDNIAIIKIENMANVKCQMSDVMNCLGGTIKIFEIVAEGSNNLIGDIANIVKEKAHDMSGKLNLGISDYRSNEVRTKSSRPKASNDINIMGLKIKNILKKSHNTRFIALRDSNELSSIVSYKNKLDSKGVEIGLFEISNSKFLISNQIPNPNDPKANKLIPNSCFLGRLVAVTNPEEWSKRDYDKPRGDKYSGMTPPKLARALVNIALSQAISNYQFSISNENSEIDKLNENCELKIENYNDFVVVDPFCGSGNILMEAAMLGCGVVGSDISEKAVADTKANLEWLRQNFQFSIFNFQSNLNGQISNVQTMKQSSNEVMIFHADATSFDFSEKLEARSLQLEAVIVTEPYLGQPKKFAPSMNAARGEYQKIKKLYLDFLKNVSSSKYQVASITIIFPLVETQEGTQYSLLNESIDEIKEMGYTLVCKPMIYGRDYQVVKREIALLKHEARISKHETNRNN